MHKNKKINDQKESGLSDITRDAKQEELAKVAQPNYGIKIHTVILKKYLPVI